MDFHRLPRLQKTLSPLATLAAFLMFAAAGCGGRYASVRFDASAGQALEEGTVLQGHRYYTTGSETDPAAILALREDRPLRPGPWREVAMTPQLLAHLAKNMRGTRPLGPDGHVILDGGGKPIGAWYSYLRPPVVKLLEDGSVEVPTPFRSDGDGSDDFRPPVR